MTRAEKGLNFGPAGVRSVGCRSILLEIANLEFLIVQLIYKYVEDFHICSCCDGCIEEDGTNYVPPGHPIPNNPHQTSHTKHQSHTEHRSSLNEGVLHSEKIPLHFSHNEPTPVQISLQYLHWCVLL